MTKKDYIAIARAIRNRSFMLCIVYSEHDSDRVIKVDDVVDLLSEVMRTDNPLFNAEKFKAACK